MPGIQLHDTPTAGCYLEQRAVEVHGKVGTHHAVDHVRRLHGVAYGKQRAVPWPYVSWWLMHAVWANSRKPKGRLHFSCLRRWS